MEDLEETMYVYPWKGILANIKRTFNETKNRYDGESGSKLREELASKGFNPQKVQPLWESGVGHTGFAIVMFGKEWDGFRNSRNFEKHFEVNRCGKSDYDAAGERGDKLYGWIAKKEDFHSRTVIGDHLKKQGDLQTVSGIEEEERRKQSIMVKQLENSLETKESRIQQMERIYKETSMTLEKTLREKDEMINAHNEKMSRMQRWSRDYKSSIYIDHEKASQYLESKRKKIEDQEKYVELNKAEGRKVQIEKAIEEQKKADEAMAKLAEQLQKEEDEHRKTVCELLQKADAEEAIELEIVRLRGSLEVMRHMEESDAEDEAMAKLAEQHQKEKDELRKTVCELLQKADAEESLELDIVRLRGSLEVMRAMEESEETLEVVIRDALEVLMRLA